VSRSSGFLDAVEEQLGPIDVLVNNAGVMHIGLFLDHDEARARRMIEVNLVGTLNGMQLALPRMLERGRGHVVNVASTAGKLGVKGGSVYCATKHAVVGLSEAVRAELSDTPVRVSVVMPGPVNTELARGISNVRGVGLIEPEQVADAVVGALRTGRFEVYVPGVAGVMLRALAVLPRSVRDPLERAGRMHDAFTHVDEGARAVYEARVAAGRAPVDNA
jgi:short-subunit dehydrogenase